MAKNISKYFLLAFLPILSLATASFAQVPQVQHVFIVLEENTDNGDVCGPGAASMPFLCSLKSQGSFSENYYAATHPSIGNYEDLAWGVVTTNDDSCDPNTCGFPYTGDNIVREVQAAGKTWKGYAENLPSTCYLGGDSGEYAVRHSPIPYISDVQSNCLNRYVAFEDPNLGFAHDLAQNTFPNYAFITPNLCDDGHDCTLPGSSVPDSWLQNNVLQPLLNSGHLDPTSGDTVVIVTFDESESDNTNGGGLIYWFMIGAGVKQNYQSTGPSTPPGYYSHESTLRVMAEMVGASFSGLGSAANAPDMAEFFGTNQPPPVSVTISPATVTVSSGSTQQFSPTVTNTTNQSVTWAATAGTISSTGLFTAPVVSTNTAVTVTATSVVAPTESGIASVTVQSPAPPPVSVAVLPASSTVTSSGTQQFTAITVNTNNPAVTWSATAGSISSTGLFTAPVVSSNTIVTVTATSVAAPSQSGSATVTVQAPAPVTTLPQTVQHNSGSVPNAGSVAVGFKNNVTAGDVLLVAQSTFDRDTLNTPIDSQGNTFSLLATADDPNNSVAAIYIASAKGTGPDTVTCSISTGASDNIHCHIYEVTGVTAVVDGVGSALQASEALSVSTSLTTTNASDYVFAYFASNNTGPTYAVGPGFGDPEQSDSPFTKSGYSDSGFSEDELVTATGVQTATATSSVTDSFTGLIVALKKSQTVTGPPPGAPSCTLSVSPSSGPVPLQVNASANCTDPQNQLVSTTITWGDGSSTNGGSGSHSYVSANSFTVTVTATDSAMLTGSATQTVTATNLAPPTVSVAVTPTSVAVSSGGTQQFTATVANTTNQGVTWVATAGTISSTGLLTAPVVSTSTTVTVTATSVVASSQSATATVQVLASGQPAPLSPSGPISINGQNGTVIQNLHITNPNGDCVTVTNSTNIVIQRSEIGPCGGNGVNISGGDTIAIYDSYIHPEKPLSTACCDNHDGIFASGTSQLSIQGNVIAYGESNIEVNNVATVAVIGNFLLNPIDSDPSQPADGQSRGQNFQSWSNSSNVTVQNNYALSSIDTTQYLFPENQEDSIDFGLTNGVTASNNYITGGHSPSGCGLTADTGANSVNFLNNILLNTGQCGIGIADGTDQLVDSNKILNQTPVNGGGNTALYVWNETSSNPPCGPVTVSNNIAAEIKSDGTQSGFWNGGGCEPVTLTNNTFDAAAQALLEPASQTMPQPAIPPDPKDCVASSPFTNNTSLLPCNAN